MTKLVRFFVACCLCIAFQSVSQNNTETIPLADLLPQLEKNFGIKFSYADKTLKNIRIQRPDATLNLEDTLKILETETGLEFTMLNDRFITIEEGNASKTSSVFQLQQLDEIVLQNYLTKGLAKTINGTIKISPQDFGILPGLIEPDILQTIQTLPGIISVDERISNINVRGGTNDQNLILYEGICMYQTGHFFGLISAFNPYLTETIDVTVNGTSAKYGSGVSSVISIQNDDEISDGFKAGFGSNLISADGFAKFQFTKNTELQVSARRSFNDVVSTPTYDAYFERIFNNSELSTTQNTATQVVQDEDFFFYDVNAKFLYDINKTSKLRANVITIFNQLDYIESSLDANNTQQGSESFLSQKSYAGNISYHKTFTNAMALSAQLYYSNYQLSGNNLDIDAEQQIIQENEVDDIGIRVDVQKSLTKTINLNGGYQYNEIGVSNLEDVNLPRFRRFIKEVVRTHGLYGEAEFTSKSKNTHGRIGLRGNYIEDFNMFLFEPRLAFSQKFLNHFRLELLGEVKSQSITQIIDLQQDFFGIEKRRWQSANDNDVPITESNQISVGINYKNDGWLISAEGYVKNVTDVTSRTQGFQNQFQFVNAIGDYSVSGLDLLVNKQFKSFSSWLSYSYSKNDFEFNTLNDGNAFPNNLDVRHIVNASLAYEMERLKIAASVNWHSGRPFTAPSDIQNDDTSISYDAPNASRISSYLRTDVSAIYSFPVSDKVNAELGASIWNLLNQKNIINRFYTRDDNGTIVQNDDFALELTPNVSFRLNF